MPSHPELTICTVSYESTEWLRLNLELVRRLNPDSGFRWLVAENSLADSTTRLGSDEPGFEVIEGAAHETKPYGSASYHHAAGLNIITRLVSTRYLLILDPDFFILRKNWIQDIIAHMRSGNVAILGAPWHPKRASKFRYFPCAHCTFIDLHKIPKETLDFAPDYENNPGLMNATMRRHSRINSLTARLTFAKRRRIGSARDTGWRLFRRHSNDPSLKIECFQPVFQPRARRRFVDNFFPDHLSLTPKRRGYFSETGFTTYGLPDLQSNGWEEFLWNNAPLGFHVRCHPIRNMKSDQPISNHYKAVKTLLDQI